MISGCSDDECPTCPGEGGTIIIDLNPDNLAGAGWSLWGPINDTGSGDSTLSDIQAGEYMLTWTDVSGYITPSPDTQTLATDETVTFSGTYVEECRVVLVSPGSFLMGSPSAEMVAQNLKGPLKTLTGETTE